MTRTQSQIQTFLQRFHEHGNEIDAVFTQGCCYWFAFILHNRFPKSEILYDPVWNHYVCEIENHIYDITGDVTGRYKVIHLDEIDEYEQKRLEKNCINF